MIKLPLKTFFSFILTLLMSISIAHADSVEKTAYRINQEINNSKIAKNSIVAVSIREASSGKIIYGRHEDLLLRPASSQKILSSAAILNTLGKNFRIKTSIYRDKKDNIYFKLGADPSFSYSCLSNLLEEFKNKGNTAIKGDFYIDDSIIDNMPRSEGWMWDDEENPYMPRFSAYNFNRNSLSINFKTSKGLEKPEISVFPYYYGEIINNSRLCKAKTLSIKRNYWKEGNIPEKIYINGCISIPQSITIPIGSSEKFFKHNLKKLMESKGIYLNKEFKHGKVPKDAVLISEKISDIKPLMHSMNKNSDNLVAETLFKLAGAKYSGKQGTTKNGVIVFKDFYLKLGMNPEEIYTADASGVSQNNLISANWMTKALSLLYKSQYLSSKQKSDFDFLLHTLAIPKQKGTLENRLLEFSGRMFAKTGTNFALSSISGFMIGADKKYYTFCIMIQNFKGSAQPAKNLEDSILKSFGIL